MGGHNVDFGMRRCWRQPRHAAAMRRGRDFGIGGEPQIDFAAVMDHVHHVIAELAPQDSEERLSALGVRVIRAEARFSGPAS